VSEFTFNVLTEMLLNFTAVAPVNPEPVMVTDVPAAPLVGEKELTSGAPSTEKALELDPVPAGVVTLINPVEASVGTTAVTCVSEITLKVPATAAPKATDVVPVKPEPLMVTEVATGPLPGEKEVIVGIEDWEVDTVNEDGLDAVPSGVVTRMGPVVAPEGTEALSNVLEPTLKLALAPLNDTDIAPVNPFPSIDTIVPLEPLVGVNELIAGGVAVGFCDVTLKDAALEAVPQLV
jgi:hypothetical protein